MTALRYDEEGLATILRATEEALNTRSALYLGADMACCVTVVEGFDIARISAALGLPHAPDLIPVPLAEDNVINLRLDIVRASEAISP